MESFPWFSVVAAESCWCLILARVPQRAETFLPAGRPARGMFAFAVKPEDLAAWREQLRQAAIPIEREVEWEEGGHSIYFRDPAGNLVELAPPTIWGGGWEF